MRADRRLSTAVALCVVLVAAGCGQTPDTGGAPDLPPAPGRGSAKGASADPIIGAKIYETERDLRDLFDEWGSLGFNTVFASQEMASSGGFRALAKKSDTDLFVIFPVFYAPDELAENPDYWAITKTGERAKDDWVEFACPSRQDFRRQRVDVARGIVKRLQPEGLSLDFIRHFVFWEMVGPDHDPATFPDTCYCVRCLQGFAVFLGLPAAAIPPQPQRAAVWIEANAADAWLRFKAETITSMAVEIADAVRAVDPDILVNVHLVPWRRDDYDGVGPRVTGQDWPALGEVSEYLSPMCYSFMLRRPPEWISSVVQDIDWVAESAVLPSVQVGTAYRENDIFSTEEFETALRAALKPPSAGVVFWSWDHIEADPEKAQVIRRVLTTPTSVTAP